MAEENVAQDAAHSIGFNVPRVWANSVQVVPFPDQTIIVFREQFNFELAEKPDEEGKMPTGAASRNVASMVLPKEVALQMARIILNVSDESDEAAADAASE